MKHARWQVWFGAGLVALSAALYLFHYAAFRDAHHIFIFLVGDIAFVPIEVLLVTLIIHQVLAQREKRSMLSKMNMAIGTFYSEVGAGLMERLARFESGGGAQSAILDIEPDWDDARFARAMRETERLEHEMIPAKGDMAELAVFLAGKRAFLLVLLENPNLLEHEEFTDLLWAVFHLAEELSARSGFETLPASDLDHLAGDMKRAYGRLLRRYISYMSHLKKEYPYLFSLAIRTNPFSDEASAIVK